MFYKEQCGCLLSALEGNIVLEDGYSSSPQLFWHREPVSWKTILPQTSGGWGWFGDDSSTLHLSGSLFLLLLHQLHLKSSGIRSQRLVTPAIQHSWKDGLE